MKLYDFVKKFGWEAFAVLHSIPGVRGEGNIFFVDSGATNALNADDNSVHGSSWDLPFATVNYAVSRCTASQGDVILVAPGHTETIEDTGTASGTTTDEFVVDKAGVSIIGLGRGSERPTITLGTATDAAITFLAGSTDCLLRNFMVISDLEDLAAGITLSATSDGTVIENVEFRDGGAAKEMILGINIAAACSDVVIKGCRFFTTDTGSSTSAAISLAGAADRLVIEDCFFSGDWNDQVITGTVAASVDVLIKNSLFRNIDGGGLAGNFNASTTGMIVNCRVAASGAEDQAAWTAAAMGVIECYTTNTLANAGRLDPVIDS